jgi:hypothetical protein
MELPLGEDIDSQAARSSKPAERTMERLQGRPLLTQIRHLAAGNTSFALFVLVIHFCNHFREIRWALVAPLHFRVDIKLLSPPRPKLRRGASKRGGGRDL